MQRFYSAVNAFNPDKNKNKMNDAVEHLTADEVIERFSLFLELYKGSEFYKHFGLKQKLGIDGNDFNIKSDGETQISIRWSDIGSEFKFKNKDGCLWIGFKASNLEGDGGRYKGVENAVPRPMEFHDTTNKGSNWRYYAFKSDEEIANFIAQVKIPLQANHTKIRN